MPRLSPEAGGRGAHHAPRPEALSSPPGAVGPSSSPISFGRGRRDQRQRVRHPVTGVHHVLVRLEDGCLHFAPRHSAGGADRGGWEADPPAGIRPLLQPGGGDHPASGFAIPSHLFRNRDRDGFPILRPPPCRSGHSGSGHGRPVGQHQRGGPPAFRHHACRAGSSGAVGEHG